MGRLIIESISETDDMELVVAIDEPNTEDAGRDAGLLAGIEELGVKITGGEKLKNTLKKSDPDVLIDFTVAGAAVENVKTAASLGIPVVVGTTGFSDDQWEEMVGAIEENGIPAVIASNMSLGVNMFYKLVEEVAEKLSDYDMELVETHHNKKVDAPSGTALTAARLAAEASGKDFEEVARYGRPKGEIGERSENEIGIHSIRAGNITGDHKFIFAGPNERLELTHKAQNRQAFVDGVLRAVRYIHENGEPGEVMGMKDILFGE